VVATVSAIYGLGDPESYFKMVMHLSRGEIIDQRGVLRQLAELQYTRNDIDFSAAPIACAVMSSISSRRIRRDLAIRVELFDEEIENIATPLIR
jgi:excinuclease ABC subunit B